MARDLVFGLSLKSDKFDSNMKRAGAELRKLSMTRLKELRKEMADVGKEGGKLSKQKLGQLRNEYKSLQQTLKVTEGQAKKTATAMGGVLSGLKLGVGIAAGMSLVHGIGRGIRRAIGIIPEAIESALEGQRIDETLKLQLAKVGQGGAFESLNVLSDRIQTAFKIDDEEVRQGFTVLIRSGMDAHRVFRTAGLAADIAKAKNISYAQSAEALGRVYNGELRSLKQLGIFIASTGDKRKDAIAGMEALQRAFSGAGAAAAAKENPFIAMKLVIADMVQLLGDKLLPRITPVLERISAIVTVFAQSTQFSAVLARLADTIGKLFEFAFQLVKAFDLSKISNSLIQIVKAVGVLLFDLLAAVGTRMAEVIGETLPWYLGGGKSKGQKALDYAWKHWSDPGARAKARGNLQKVTGLPGKAGKTAQRNLEAIARMERGERTWTDAPAVESILDKHLKSAQRNAAATAGSNVLGNIQAPDSAAAQRQIYAITGVSLGPVAPAPPPTATRSTPPRTTSRRTAVRVICMEDMNLHPVAGTA